jgi:hypothetical protein
MESNNVISLGRLDCGDRGELDNTNLVLDCLWFDVTIVKTGRDYFLHNLILYELKIKIRESRKTY